ncbi:MAG: 2-dehydro-3-deoxy-D-gluconate 5-dehydrogenase [Blastocatellia bacterium]|jgi:NAD(P)-dependent dehydrogenase (short-subunit alcohol dehydrogenase family)|nr:2-dehydro-3-deoxy-D-gluconate 5-dehydrogenase [Blastocatellia bacterium]
MGSADIEMSGQRSAQDFAGRVVIVTGAWSGLGRAAAESFHERGAAVAVNVRDRVRAESLAASIGERTLAVPGDIAAPGAAEEIVRMTLERFGRIDVIVNNAALALSTRFPDLTAEEWRTALEVNLTAPFLMTKSVLPAMRAQPVSMRSQVHETRDWRNSSLTQFGGCIEGQAKSDGYGYVPDLAKSAAGQ